MKIVKLDREATSNVTIELSIRELNTLRNLIHKSVAIEEKHGFLINTFTKALVWELNCIRNIAFDGMVCPGDALDWVEKLGEKVDVDAEESKPKTEVDAEGYVESDRDSEFSKLHIKPVTEDASYEDTLSEGASREDALNPDRSRAELLKRAKSVLNHKHQESDASLQQSTRTYEAERTRPSCEVKNW